MPTYGHGDRHDAHGDDHAGDGDDGAEASKGFSEGGGSSVGPFAAHTHAEFNCLHVSAQDLSSTNRLRAAALGLPLDVPTLIVREVGEMTGEFNTSSIASIGSSAAAAAAAAASSASSAASASPRIVGASGAASGVPAELLWMRAPLPAAASRVFASPLQVGDFYPYWDAVEVSDAVTGRPTLAYDLVQQLACSAAKRVHGNAGHEFVHGVCHWRSSGVLDGGRKSRLAGSQLSPTADVCSTLWAA
jgi:hypothetical protein